MIPETIAQPEQGVETPTSPKYSNWCAAAGVAATTGVFLAAAGAITAVVLAIIWGAQHHGQTMVQALLVLLVAFLSGIYSGLISWTISVVLWHLVGEPVTTFCQRKQGPGPTPAHGPKQNPILFGLLTGIAAGLAGLVVALVLLHDASIEPPAKGFIAGTVLGCITGISTGIGITIDQFQRDPN